MKLVSVFGKKNVFENELEKGLLEILVERVSLKVRMQAEEEEQSVSTDIS